MDRQETLYNVAAAATYLHAGTTQPMINHNQTALSTARQGPRRCLC